MRGECWQFAIDVGGTFCDVIARTPSGETLTHKLLSSGRTRGRAAVDSGRLSFVDEERLGNPDGFWKGFNCAWVDCGGRIVHQSLIANFDASSATLELGSPLPTDVSSDARYELFSDLPPPVLAMRYLMRLSPGEPIPECHVRLGTTQATNALLERRGANVVFITTAGFGDLLIIGDQTRLKLFDLEIKKPPPLYKEVIEAAERIDSRGRVMMPLDVDDVRSKLVAVRGDGIESVAICLMNSYRNSVHELAIAEIARDAGFTHVSVSTDLSPTQRILHRAENCVVDAYLGPVFRDDFRAMEEVLPGSHVRLMTGAGGLVGVDHFYGAAGIMSGPAGGLVGAADVARRCSADHVITFDMGGTSTDVSRFDGKFEYQNETTTAGVRIVSPMLAIETVAAGGGSICSFAGSRFQVGPQSAGSDPGPACYGRGGPLTLTDVNLYLGRLQSARFPFSLDREIVSERFSALACEVENATGRRMSQSRMAEGFLEIANEKMAAAVKRITIERGIDVGEYALVCFGGAGGQHACAVARSLGIRKVLVPRLAGVLSAYGIAVADVKRFAERMVHEVYTDDLPARLAEQFEKMERSLIAELVDEGVGLSDVRCTRWLDMRYRGEGSTLTLEAGDCAQQFEAIYRERYGYVRGTREKEVVSARVEAVGVLPKLELSSGAATKGSAQRLENVRAVFGGECVDTPVFDGAGVGGDFVVDGPAVVLESDCTIVVEPGWRLSVGKTGEMLLTDEVGSSRTEIGSADADPVRIELFNNHFAAIAEQMGSVLRRTAVSTNVKERLDYSCAVFGSRGDLIANAPHIPVHIGSMGECVKSVLADTPDLGENDVIVTNDPFRGGTHLPDVTVVTPVFVDGERTFLVASRAHHAEIGGRRPGSMPPDSMNLTEEGILIRGFKIVADGGERFGELRTLLTTGPYPSRSPDENLADLAAQIAANKAGVEALRALVHRYGLPVVTAYTGHVRDAAEKEMSSAINSLSDGLFRFSDSMDDGSLICVGIRIRGSRAWVDFTGTSPPVTGNLNATLAIVSSAVLYCFRCLIDKDIPLNAGVMAPIEMIVPFSMVNPAGHADPERCPAVAGGNVETSQRIVDCVLGALGVAAASQGTMNNLVFGDARFAYYETICGGSGAGPTFDGADAVHTHMTNTRITDAEVLEDRYPVRVRRFAVRRGSGGAGRHRGGDGCIRELEFLDRLDLSLITQRRDCQPFGLESGRPGRSGVNRLIRAAPGSDPFGTLLPPVAHFTVHAGDRLIIETPGGGGFGEAQRS